MYSSIQEWCTFPIYLHKYTAISVSGDSSYDAATEQMCYRVDEVKKIIDKEGKEYISMTHVYMPPTVAVSAHDKLAFPDDLEPREIRLLNSFGDGNTGSLDIYVAYL